MKVCIAIDSFKGSLSTFEAGEAAKRGVLAAYPGADVSVSPLADGGEGTVDAIISATGGKTVTVTVTGPLGKKVDASYGMIPAKKTAIIEMASAAGLTLVPKKDRNPLYTTTYGVGELILHAMGAGCREFIIGIGGSATNDGGVGMLTALGAEFLDKKGAPIKRGAAGLADLAEIRTYKMPRALEECHFSVACDVTNPLCGKNGCSAIYGPQKGATPMTISDMDRSLRKYATLTRGLNPKADPEHPGAGAAGGLGFAFLSYLNSELRSGIDLVNSAIGLEDRIRSADVVVTGEGRLDGQSAMGKGPVGVARLAKKHGKPVVALAGCLSKDAALCHAEGIDAFFSILREPVTLAEAMKPEVASRNITLAAEEAFRLIRTFKKR